MISFIICFVENVSVFISLIFIFDILNVQRKRIFFLLHIFSKFKEKIREQTFEKYCNSSNSMLYSIVLELYILAINVYL